jgi:hypothetical protein
MEKWQQGKLPDYPCLEKFLELVAQAFQPVPRKQVNPAQPGKADPPANTRFSCFTGGAKAHARLLRKVFWWHRHLAGAVHRLEACATKV